jgi:hypothetical protein
MELECLCLVYVGVLSKNVVVLLASRSGRLLLASDAVCRESGTSVN